MIDAKEAYRLLGVSEGAGKDEIIKRYDILLKKHKVSSQMGEVDTISLKDINEAYNVLMGYESEEANKGVPEKPNPILSLIYRKFRLDEKKVNNFFHYHKMHIIISIIAIIVVFTTVRGCINRVDPDLYMTLLGEIYVTDTELVQNSIKENLPGVVAPQVDPIFLSDKEQGEQAYAMQMKAMTMMAAGDMDLIISDKASFEIYAKQGAFVSLEELAKELGVDKEKNKDYIIKPEESDKEELYGINVTESAFLKEQNVKGKELIASIRVKAKHHDKAVELLRLIVKNN